MSKTKTIFLIVIVAAILSPLLFFPLSGDTSLYLYIGKILGQGGSLYVDAIDLKQPPIYYLFMVFQWIAGYDSLAVRSIDFAIQAITIFLLFRLTVRITDSYKTASFASVAYALLYTSFNFSQTFQLESFINILVLGIVSLRIKKSESAMNALLIGMLAGLMTGMKLTLGLILPALLLDVLISEGVGNKIKRFFALSGGFVFALLITLLPLLDGDVYSGFKSVLQFLSYYSNSPKLDFEFIRNFIYEIGNYFGNYFTLPFSLFLGVSFVYMFNKRNDKFLSDMSGFMFLILITMLSTLFIERKFASYYTTRAFVPFMFFVGMGFNYFFDSFKEYFKRSDWLRKTLLIITMLLLIILSPVLKWFKVAALPYYYFNDYSKYEKQYQDNESASVLLQQQNAVAGYLNKMIKPTDKVIIMTTGSNILNTLIHSDNQTKVTQSCFYFSAGSITEWKSIIIDEVMTADYLVIQTNDRHLYINGHTRSTWESFKLNDVLYSYLKENFSNINTIGNFMIFKKKPQETAKPEK